MLKVENCSISIGPRQIVAPLSFKAENNTWWMLLGPNGAGKTTLLNALSMLLPSTGSISFNGQDLSVLSIRKRAQLLGMLSQNSSISADFTVEQIVAMGRYSRRNGIWGADEPDLAFRVNQALEQTGMTAFRHQSMLKLSGGERQRAFLAQVFCQDPQILLLDEPANHLDLIYQKQIFELLDAWRKQPGKQIISVVHDLNLARCFGTHALLMDQGQMIAQGAIHDVLTDKYLNQVWQMDVRAWRESMYAQWM